MRNNLAYNAYSQNNIAIESPIKLIEMMYEGILKFSSLAVRSIELENVEKKVYYINKTVAIFTELTNTLDYERGKETAHYLAGLYEHQIKLLSLANLENDKEYISTVINVGKTLLQTWREEHSELMD